jgi:hypothetical protein
MHDWVHRQLFYLQYAFIITGKAYTALGTHAFLGAAEIMTMQLV